MIYIRIYLIIQGAARPITTPITTYHIKHAPATSHKNQVNSLYMYKLTTGSTKIIEY